MPLTSKLPSLYEVKLTGARTAVKKAEDEKKQQLSAAGYAARNPATASPAARVLEVTRSTLAEPSLPAPARPAAAATAAGATTGKPVYTGRNSQLLIGMPGTFTPPTLPAAGGQPNALVLLPRANPSSKTRAVSANSLTLPTYADAAQINRIDPLARPLTREEFLADTPAGNAARQAVRDYLRDNADVYGYRSWQSKQEAAKDYLGNETLRGVGDTVLNIANTVGGTVAGYENKLTPTVTGDGMLALETANSQERKYAEGASDFIENSTMSKLLDESAQRSEELYNKTDKSDLVQFGGALANTAGSMLPAVLATVATGGAGAPAALGQLVSAGIISASSYSSALRRAKAEGASDSDAADYALLSSFIEGASDILIGGVAGVGSGIVDTATKGVLSKLASGIDDPVLRAAGIYLFKNVLGEGIEGGLQSAADTLAQRATYNPGAELDWGRVGSDVMRSAALGGLYGLGEFGANLNSYADAKPASSASAGASADADIDWNAAVNNAPLTEADIADALGVKLGEAGVDSLADMAYNGSGKTTEGAGKTFKFSEMTPDDAMKIAQEYRTKAPIEIPESATIKPASKVGYEQITYNWNDNGYRYEVRWHTRTPGAPESQGNTWVIKREIPGNGGQKPRSFYKIGNTGTDEDWVRGMDWFDAIRARDAGTATQKQIEILDMGHWKE